METMRGSEVTLMTLKSFTCSCCRSNFNETCALLSVKGSHSLLILRSIQDPSLHGPSDQAAQYPIIAPFVKLNISPRASLIYTFLLDFLIFLSWTPGKLLFTML